MAGPTSYVGSAGSFCYRRNTWHEWGPHLAKANWCRGDRGGVFITNYLVNPVRTS